MKASVKVREGSSPLFRAKLPLTFLGLPITSGITVASTKELGLHFGSLFHAGPSCKITYAPNDSDNPFTVLIKTGLGLWGSPKDAPVTVSAQFKLSSKGTPAVAVHVKPRLGSFGVRKSSVSPCMNVETEVDEKHEDLYSPRTPEKIYPDVEMDTLGENSPPSSEGSSLVMVSSQEGGEDQAQQLESTRSEEVIDPVHVQGESVDSSLDSKPGSLHVKTTTAEKTLSRVARGDWSLVAHTALPLGRHAVANVRWRVKLEPDMFSSFQVQPDIFSLRKLPVLVVDKLSIEPRRDPVVRPRQPLPGNLELLELENPELGKVASMCSAMKRQLRYLYVENWFLKKTMEDMKAELCGNKGGKSNIPTYMVTNDGDFQKMKTDSKDKEKVEQLPSSDQQGYVIKRLES